MTSSYARNAIVLGVLSALGPFAIDMYLPALPIIATDLHASAAATQMTLTAFFFSYGVCQIAYGLASDAFGRKPPLYFGLGLFLIGSAGCAASPAIGWLIFFRFVQGVGASSVVVIPRAVIRDLHTGIEATRLMSLVMLVLSVSPILAPLTGSLLITPFGWRAIFVAVILVAAIGFGLAALFLPETRPRDLRARINLASALRGFAQLLRHQRFVAMTFIGGFSVASFFVFLAGSSFIYMDHFGLSSRQFSLAFAVNAIGFIGSAQFAAPLAKRFGMVRLVVIGVSLYAFFALLLFGLTAAGVDSLRLLIAMLFLTFSCLGVVVPSAMVLALDEHGPIAGMASALAGTLQMFASGLVIVVVSMFFYGDALPMTAAIAFCSIAALALCLVTLGRPGRAAALAPD